MVFLEISVIFSLDNPQDLSCQKRIKSIGQEMTCIQNVSREYSSCQSTCAEESAAFDWEEICGPEDDDAHNYSDDTFSDSTHQDKCTNSRSIFGVLGNILEGVSSFIKTTVLGIPKASSSGLAGTRHTEQEWIEIVQEDWYAFEDAPEEIRSNRNIILAAIKNNPDNFASISQGFLIDRKFALEAVSANGYALGYLPEDLKNDAEIVKAALAENGNAIGDVSKELRSRRDIALLAAHNGGSLHHLPAFRNDKEIVLAAVSHRGSDIKYASDELKNDADIVMAAIITQKRLFDRASVESPNSYPSPTKQYPPIIEYASDSLRSDRDFALAAVKADSRNMEFISQNLLEDNEFINSAVLSNFEVTEYLDQATKERYTTQFANAFSLLGIDHPERFDTSDYVEIIRNRYSVSSEGTRNMLEQIFGVEFFAGTESDERPVCVIIFPESDPNGAFLQDAPTISALTTGYRVIYYDIKTDYEFAQSLREATLDNGQQAELCIIGGHGNRYALQFGDYSWIGDREAAYMDMFLDRNLIDSTRECISDGGNVVLLACSTGEGTDGRAGVGNLAEFAHTIWPQAGVYAPTAPAAYVRFELDEEGILLNATYVLDEGPVLVEIGDELHTYYIGPSSRERLRYDVLGIIEDVIINPVIDIYRNFANTITGWLKGG